MQILILRNLVSKLRKNNNHYYTSLIKDLIGLFKNELGPTNYALLTEAFGLAWATTASRHSSESHLDPGINCQALKMASSLLKKNHVNKASDKARALRYLEVRKNANGEVILVGEGWNPNVKHWHLQKATVPRRNVEKGHKDDFSALKRYVDKVIKRLPFQDCIGT